MRLAWALSVQNPPLFIVYDFKTFNPDEVVRFHSSDPDSDEVKAVLWPALQEGIEGSIVHKSSGHYVAVDTGDWSIVTSPCDLNLYINDASRISISARAGVYQ